MKSTCGIFKRATEILVWLVFFMTYKGFLPQVTGGLQIDSSSNFEKVIDKSLSLLVTPLLDSFPSICVISQNKEFLDIFIKRYIVTSKMFTLLESGKTPVYNCESAVMLDVIPPECGSIADKKFALYFLHYSTSLNVTRFEKCFQNIFSPEVVIISLKDSSLFELSPNFPLPRLFTESSVEDVISHRGHDVEDFGGTNITGAFMKYAPFTLIKQSEGKPDEIDGVEVILFKELSRKLNFTLHYLFYNSWGKDTPNGTWTSGVGWAMQEKLAQVAVSGLWQLYAFDPLVDFGPSIAMEELIFLVRRPELIEFDWKVVMKTFKIIVWYSLLASFVLVTTVYWFGVIRVLPSYREDWTFSAVTVFGHFTTSTSHSYFSDRFTRLVLISWSVSSMLMTSLLSTGIVSGLTLPRYSPRVDTIQQLVEGDYYWTAQFYREFGSAAIKASMFDFKDSWHTLLEKKYRYMAGDEVNATACYDEKITFSSQILEDLVVLDTTGILQHEALGKFRVAREAINKGHVAFGVEKHSPMLKPLSKMTLRFLQAGLQKRWIDAVIERWPEYDTRHLLLETDELTFSQPEVIHFTKLRPLFYLLVAGLALATIVFCVEIMWAFI